MPTGTAPDALAQYSRALRAAESYPELESLLLNMSAALGFDYFVLKHEIDDPARVNLVDVLRLPEPILQAVAEMRGEGYGPLARIARRRASGFMLAADRLPGLTETHKTFFRKARAAGGGDGYIVPCNVQDDVCGWVAFGMSAGRAFPFESLPAAQYLGVLAYDASLRIGRASSPRAEAHPELTPRQIECIVHVGRGKGDWEIGQLLGISPDTAHKHIQSAMKKFDVSTRTQLVVRALHAQQVSFKSIIG